MIITLKNADFSLSNIGTLNTWSVIRALGSGAQYEGPIFVSKGSSLQATITFNAGYEMGTSGVSIKMGGALLSESVYSIEDTKITINIPQVTGTVEITVSTKNTATGEENNNTTPVWVVETFVLESGTTDDDAKGTMGNLVSNVNRTRTSTAIKGDLVKFNSSTDLNVWINIFDASGKLVGTSPTTIAMTDAGVVVNAAAYGGSQVWPIFRTRAGTEPLSVEQKASISIQSMTVLEGVIRWTIESGTFSDATGEKEANTGRLRTSSKIAVPANATGLRFMPTGSFDLWIKGYSSDIAKPDLCNGLGSLTNGIYWNTKYAGVQTLTWDKIIPGGTRPAYLDFVLTANAGILYPVDAFGVAVGFTYS